VSAQLINEILQKAEQSEPPVKAAALLYIARVLAAFDRPEAERMLEEGIELIFALPKPAADPLLDQAISLAATVSPKRALSLMPLIPDRWHGRMNGIIFPMLRHGHIADAVSWLSDPSPQEEYPFNAALEAIGRSKNEEARRNILRGAIRARLVGSKFRSHGFEDLFSFSWEVLPGDEARTAVRKIVQRIIEEPDPRTDAKFSSGQSTAQFSSTREATLFETFGPVSQLDPELAASLCRKYHSAGESRRGLSPQLPSGA
jgi:hypothetical protein